MPHRVRLAEIIKALSRALDMTEGQPPGHCIGCCHIGTAIGHSLGLGETELRDLYYTLMLKDLGCTSNAARICQIYETDDIRFKRNFKLVDGSLAEVLRFLVRNTAAEAGPVRRAKRLLQAMKNGAENTVELIRTRCENGADIARQMRFSDDVAAGIRDLDEHFDGSGHPLGKVGETIHLFARIALLAQVVEVFFHEHGPQAAVDEIGRRRGTWFDPQVVDAFMKVAANTRFWQDLASPELEEIVLGSEPGHQAIMADEDYLDDIALGFARVIDAKSPYTSGHSSRVAAFTDLIAEQMGLTEARRRRLKRAALLHDIGKLGVSNSVLDKPGPLNQDEWQAMRRHAEFSEEILSHIAAFADIAAMGGAHHERLDGKGYPRGLKGAEINLDTRILSTADVFDALTADRPYRAALPVTEALTLLWRDAGLALDPACISALERGLQQQDQLRGFTFSGS
ncbi:HD-GYP domain-containing protein [Rhizobium paknamense]|uniref:HD-GYP domain-containing protein (C-di-GMP phosphodiesterase class II) n=1 Tax=Rhizobium paknamense TaxID=1206817 RepID=A0ABU0I899_9HYPH|nr:HD domain-containing protein [Rhizobium paknamense]MDQ0454469.1 HD-GYP domain-containing protein (c-di-GMP phosphodiesterase class II) [Rhizobium paknamense]